MGHIISGFIALKKDLEVVAGKYPHAHLIPLPQDYAFIPMSDELKEQLFENQEFAADMQDNRFRYLDEKLFQMGRKLSKDTKLAYIETDYYGGTGFQCGVAWSDGEIEFGPAATGKEEGYQMDSEWGGAINRALMEIGVSNDFRDDGDYPKDEFDELGLGKFRDNDDWIASVQQ